MTNPPIDRLRERLVMSLAVKLGRRGNLLVAEPEHARQVELPSPVLNDAEMAALPGPGCGRPGSRPPTRSRAGPGACARPSSGCAARPRPPCARAPRSWCSATARRRSASRGAHVPPLLAVGAVHHDLIRRGLRSRASLVVDAAQCWSVHHFACLIGYGASAVHPYLAFETVRDLWARGRFTTARRREVAPAGPASSRRPSATIASPPSAGSSRSSPRWASRCWRATTARSCSRRGRGLRPHRAGVRRHAVADRRPQRGGAGAGDGVDPSAGVPGAHHREAAQLRLPALSARR